VVVGLGGKLAKNDPPVLVVAALDSPPPKSDPPVPTVAAAPCACGALPKVNLALGLLVAAAFGVGDTLRKASPAPGLFVADAFCF